MISEFGSWYRAVEIEPNDERLQRRWAGVEKAAKACNVQSALELARLFNGIAPQREAWLSDFKKRFQDEDSAFHSDSKSAELVVLAGATVAQVLATDGKSADIAAAALQVAAFGIPPESQRIPGIRAIVAAHSIARGSAARSAPSRRSVKDRPKKIEAMFSALQSGHQQAAEPLKVICNDLFNQIEDLEERLIKSERIREESSGILWWLMGAYSEALQLPFSKVPPGVLPVVAAFELSQLTGMTPALPNAQALLLQVIGSVPPPDRTVVEWIRAIDRPIRKRLLSETIDHESGPLLPVLDAMRRSVDLASDEVWVADSSQRGDSRACSAIELAEQVHRELLLCKDLLDA